uniref:Uncharacterized protein n=1 Tax=Sphaerodactylus townsendi TaxID=933632 RepID=A0ACB8FGZ9_9SAUR
MMNVINGKKTYLESVRERRAPPSRTYRRRWPRTRYRPPSHGPRLSRQSQPAGLGGRGGFEAVTADRQRRGEPLRARRWRWTQLRRSSGPPAVLSLHRDQSWLGGRQRPGTAGSPGCGRRGSRRPAALRRYRPRDLLAGRFPGGSLQRRLSQLEPHPGRAPGDVTKPSRAQIGPGMTEARGPEVWKERQSRQGERAL